MANDYAAVIRDEFNGGPVDVIGESYGGLIAQHLAANHSELIRHLVIYMSAYKFSQEGASLDMRFAQLASQGKTREHLDLSTCGDRYRVKRAVFVFYELCRTKTAK
jgi:pimeloyl-ACP methyl ester carboxylesterase